MYLPVQYHDRRDRPLYARWLRLWIREARLKHFDNQNASSDSLGGVQQKTCPVCGFPMRHRSTSRISGRGWQEQLHCCVWDPCLHGRAFGRQGAAWFKGAIVRGRLEKPRKGRTTYANRSRTVESLSLSPFRQGPHDSALRPRPR